MTTIRVKVAEGRFVRDPATLRPLSAEGENKTLDSFWRRRIDAGDVEVVGGGTPSGVSADDRARKGGEDGETPTTARKTRGAQE